MKMAGVAAALALCGAFGGVHAQEVRESHVRMLEGSYVASGPLFDAAAGLPKVLQRPAPCAEWGEPARFSTWLLRFEVLTSMSVVLTRGAHEKVAAERTVGTFAPPCEADDLAGDIMGQVISFAGLRGWRWGGRQLIIWGEDGPNGDLWYQVFIEDGSLHSSLERILQDFGYTMGAWRFGGDDFHVDPAYAFGAPYELMAVLDRLTRSYAMRATRL